MNKQANHIITASLLLLFLFAAVFFVRYLNSVNTGETNHTLVIDNSTTEESDKSNSYTSAVGKTLFMSKCASCHNLLKDGTGPSLIGFEDRGTWADRKNVYAWIRNPSAFMKKDLYTQKLKAAYGSMMTAFPDLTNDEIDAICYYINQAKQIQYGIPLAER